MYRQRSYREDGKVKTKAEYLCPLDPLSMQPLTAKSNTPDHVVAAIRERFESGPEQKTAPSPAPAKPKGTRPRKATKNRPVFSPLALQSNLNFTALRLSPFALERRYKAHQHILHRLGIDPEHIPTISLRRGFVHRVRYWRSRNHLFVRVVNSKGAASKTRANFGRAMAEAKMLTLETGSSRAYKDLSLHLADQQRATLLELRKYLMATNARQKFTRMLALKTFGWIDPIRMGRSKIMTAKKLGLSAYGNRGSWREDAVLLLAELEQHPSGWRGVLSETQAELKAAHGTLRRANVQGFSLGDYLHGKRMSWGFRKRREIRRAEARVELQRLRLDKIKLLAAAFQM